MQRRNRRFPWWLLALAFVVVPLVEIFVIVQVGQVVGAWWTILLLLAAGLVGSWLMKREGGRAWRALQEALNHGRMPARELADGLGLGEFTSSSVEAPLGTGAMTGSFTGEGTLMGERATWSIGVICEGAETDAQLEFLRSIHCDLVQGFATGRPASIASVDAVLAPQAVQ